MLGGRDFSAKVQLLSRTAYGITHISQKAGQDFAVCKLEGLWWGSRSKTDFFHEPRDQWNWKLLIRMPDFYTRMHAAGITDTLGADLILAGLMVQAGFSLVTIKLLLIGAFLFFTSPTSTHAIANAALTAGLKPRVAEGAEAGDDSATAREGGQ